MTLSIIIVNWNSGPLLRKCLDSLLLAISQPPFAYEVFVVDNASTDTSVSEAQRSRQPFRLLALPTNQGFARANNRALREAQGEILLLLNPDTEPQPGSLTALVEFFAAHPRAGIVGGKLTYADGSRQRSVRMFPTALTLALELTRLARVFPKLPFYRKHAMTDFSYERASRVDQVMGACFAIRREVLRTVGGLDERYWLWFEEVDYCVRAKRVGWEVWFTPSVPVLHHRAVSFRQVPSWRRSWWFARSAVRYAAKHLGLGSAFALSLLVPAHLVTGVLASVVRAGPSVLRSRE